MFQTSRRILVQLAGVKNLKHMRHCCKWPAPLMPVSSIRMFANSIDKANGGSTPPTSVKASQESIKVKAEIETATVEENGLKVQRPVQTITGIRTVKDFRQKVLKASAQMPHIVLYKSEQGEDSMALRDTLISESLRLKGQFVLCMLDADEISEKLRSGLQLKESPSVLLLYRQNIVNEFQGALNQNQLQEMTQMIQFLYNTRLEEKMVAELFTGGQECLTSGRWQDAIGMFEQAQSMKRWPLPNDTVNEQKMLSSLALAFSQVGNLSQTKHYVRLYNDGSKSDREQGVLILNEDQKSEYNHNVQTASNFILSLAGPSRSPNDKDGGDSDNGGNNSFNQSTVDLIKTSEDGSKLSDYANRYPFIKQENFTIESEEEVNSSGEEGLDGFKPVEGDRSLLVAEARECITLFEYERATHIALSLLYENYDDADAHMIILETFNELGFRNQLVMDTRTTMREIMLNVSRQE